MSKNKDLAQTVFYVGMIVVLCGGSIAGTLGFYYIVMRMAKAVFF